MSSEKRNLWQEFSKSEIENKNEWSLSPTSTTQGEWIVNSSGETLDEQDSKVDEFEQLNGDTRQPARGIGPLSKVKIFLLGLGCICLLGVVILYGVPFLLEKVIIPVMDWEVHELSPPVLAVLSIFSLSFFPAILLPTGPTMWVVGVLFGYGQGLALILVGYIIGTSLPYFLGHWLFHERVQEWLLNNPRNAALLKLADDGDLFHQLRVVILLRLSPIPYAVLNYAITATKIKYFPYIFGSTLLLIPEALLAIYVGRLLRALADFHQQKRRRLTPLEMASQGIGLAIAIIVSILGMYYGKKALAKLEEEEEETQKNSKQLLEVHDRSLSSFERGREHTSEISLSTEPLVSSV